MKIIEVKNDPWLLTNDAFEIYSQCMYKAIYSEYANEIVKMTVNPDCHIFSCNESGKIMGIVVLKLTSEDTAEIVGIAVDKSTQRNGIGRFMLLSAAKHLNLKELTAETDSETVGFYKQTGFIVKPFLRRFSDGDVVRYQCHLSI